ncbi:S41 family peptidase [uncultured Imperialibacter sp.]|uniref:S41 family peptidase n=1 Tax=uncultured Imperialibacter sp. TaxID=1672639 RepID=UPI0030D8A6C7
MCFNLMGFTKMTKTIAFILVGVILFGCERAFFEDEPEDTYVSNFEVFWSEFDRNYSFFELKNIDWDSLYHVYRPLAELAANDGQFFQVLAKLSLELKDGHVNVISPYGVSTYDFANGERPVGAENVKPYLYNVKQAGSSIEYAELLRQNVGYIHIKTFGGDIEDYEKIDDILEALKKEDGLIVDVRSNGGGSTTKSQTIASRFADKERLYLKVKYKNGPGHGDFTDWDERTVSPEGPSQYNKPVVVLTDKKTFSASEEFVLAMRLFPQVTIVGDTTGGGSGNPILRELPNGWVFRLSSWIAADPDNNTYEGIGLVPDIPVTMVAQNSLDDTDYALLEALRVLDSQ